MGGAATAATLGTLFYKFGAHSKLKMLPSEGSMKTLI
jgi:hypothetical protein